MDDDEVPIEEPDQQSLLDERFIHNFKNVHISPQISNITKLTGSTKCNSGDAVDHNLECSESISNEDPAFDV